MNRTGRKTCLPLALLLLLVCPASLLSQPVRAQVLADVKIFEQREQIDALISFNFPIRYIRHFPAATGDELQIQFEPMALNADDPQALYHREAIHAMQGNPAEISEVVYEGASVTGFRVTVYFSQPQVYSVAQGEDYRSILLKVSRSIRENK
jgi:hypothetical protein